MAYTNIIGILLSAKDEASAVIRKTAAETKAATGEVNALGSSSGKVGDIFSGKFTPALLTVGGTIALFSEAAHKAGDFQQQLTKLVTSAGESQSNLTLVGDGIKKLSIETGASTTDLANGMYIVESAGQHGADGLMVLKAAEQGAKAEGSDLATVADAVTSALQDYHLGASDAAMVTTKLVAATGAGKTTFQNLAAAMPAILPVASAAHVSLNDILGDLASMTIHGMSADQAAQNLAHTIRSLQSPTAQQAKELALLGMTTTQLASDLQNKGLSGTLQEITTKIKDLVQPGSDKVILSLTTALNGLSPKVKELGMHLFDGSMSAKEYAKAAAALDPISAKQAQSFGTLAGSMHRIGDQQTTGAQVMQNYVQALNKTLGTADGLNVALMLTGENTQTTTDAIKAVSGATVEAGNNVKGWADIQGNFNMKWDQFRQIINVAILTLGQGLLPILTNVLGALINALTAAANGFGIFIGAIQAVPDAINGAVGWFDRLKTRLEVHMPNSVHIAHQAMDLLGRTFDGAQDVVEKLSVKFDHANSRINDFVSDSLWKVKDELKEHFPYAVQKAKAALIDLSDPALLARKVIDKIKEGIKDFDSWVGTVHDDLIKFKNEALEETRKAIDKVKDGLSDAKEWFDKNHDAIQAVATVLGVIFGPALAKATVEAGINATKIALSGIASGAGWVTGAVAGSYAWAVNSVKMLLLSTGLRIGMTLDAIQAGYGWVIASTKASVAWVISTAKMSVTTAISAVKMAISAADAGWAWVFNATRVAIVWTAQFAIVAREAAATAIKSGVQALIAGTAWVIQAARTSVAWVVTELPKIVAGFIATAMAGSTQSGITAAAWVASAVRSSTAWVIEELPKIVAGFIAMAASSVTQAAITAGAWVAAAVTGSESFAAFKLLVSTPMVMPAIVVAAAIAAIMLVLQAIQQVQSAMDAVNQAAADAAHTKSLIDSTNAQILQEYKTQTDPAKKQRERDYLHKAGVSGFASGGFTGMGASNEVAGVVHKGEYVLPKSAVDQSTGLPKAMRGGGSSVTINGGLHIHNQMDKDRFLKDLGWRLSLS